MAVYSIVNLFLLFPALISAKYSVHYVKGVGNPKLIGERAEFTASPSAEHVADIYTRLSGLAPILREDNFNLPTTDLLQERVAEPMILEIRGGSLPVGVANEVIRSGNFYGPSVDDVSAELKSHGIRPEIQKMNGNIQNANDIRKWLAEQNRPVVIVHHEEMSLPVAKNQRRLADNSTGPPLSEEDISTYQICLWTGVILVVLMLSSVCSICYMDVVPDSLLFAKFQSSRTNKID